MSAPKKRSWEKPKPTPGPWEIDSEGFITTVGKYESITEYAGCGSHEVLWHNEADKALVIAAPTMLEALEGLNLVMPPENAQCHVGILPQSRCNHCNRIKAAIAAIALAKGEA